MQLQLPRLSTPHTSFLTGLLSHLLILCHWFVDGCLAFGVTHPPLPEMIWVSFQEPKMTLQQTRLARDFGHFRGHMDIRRSVVQPPENHLAGVSSLLSFNVALRQAVNLTTDERKLRL
ncbi:uncharacterized protein BCR38DRAFT_153052 [Pseudomassariella vexata]|uniref:Uncharacterized protein n=1 Tax=Pseudomassariella vexata TaxID=1141098 RepID=A0A1Y2E6N2_9PEZI|nr:uncharacterized protein BCR38DRAFT_153052 [Pseudomassariella vexata]ORY67218.1 hypothetical protein BCR38DRAFT_153052 [Pseudomassariella vexata]